MGLCSALLDGDAKMRPRRLNVEKVDILPGCDGRVGPMCHIVSIAVDTCSCTSRIGGTAAPLKIVFWSSASESSSEAAVTPQVRGGAGGSSSSTSNGSGGANSIQ